MLGRISQEGHRLRHIIDELLWLARADDEGTSAQREQRTDIATAVQVCGERFQPVATGRGVNLVVEVEGAEPYWIQANASWIDRLVGVLVDNACRYAGTGGCVRVEVGGNGSRVFLRVDDTGPGIPVSQRSLVFDRFHRGTDEPGGVGLGLAIADSVVRASGGTWSVTSAPSGGARMEVSWRRSSGRGSNGGAIRPGDGAPFDADRADPSLC